MESKRGWLKRKHAHCVEQIAEDDDVETRRMEIEGKMKGSGGWALTIEVLTNHLELHIESKRVRASCIRFYGTLVRIRRNTRKRQRAGTEGKETLQRIPTTLYTGKIRKKRIEELLTTLSSSYNI